MDSRSHDEAIRDLARAREDAVNARTQARQQLRGFLLRHEVRYAGKSAWSKTYERWLAKLSFPRAETGDGVHRILASGERGR